MGLNGKKYLEFSKGEKKATPKPPVVIASKIECDKHERKKNKKTCQGLFGSNRKNQAHTRLTKNAKKIECEKPLCPQKES
jgi:hypothetical protein